MLYEWWEKHKRWLLSGAVLLFLALSYLLHQYDSFEQAPLPLESPAFAAETKASLRENTVVDASSDKAAQQPDASPVMYAEIKGQVKNPGMYEFLDNERVAHLIAKAGGLLPEADQQRVNLAQRLKDGISIHIPAKGEQLPSSGPCDPAQAGSVTATPQSESSGPSADGKVNLNTATLQELQTLPGVGETRAQAILAYREKHGPFSKPEDLKKVTGIGEKTYLQLKEKISVK